MNPSAERIKDQILNRSIVSDKLSWFLQHNVLLLEGFSLLAKPAMRPRMVFRALRPPMILGASLPGMIFPAQRPAEGSNSYHYGSHATVLYAESF